MTQSNRLTRTAILLAGALLLFVPGPSQAGDAPQLPTWKILKGKTAPADALRLFGNRKPPSGTLARGSWDRYAARAERNREEAQRWSKDTSEEGRRRYEQAQRLVAQENPAICRTFYRGKMVSGVLDEKAGVCVLDVLAKGADPAACSRARSMNASCRPHIRVRRARVYVLRSADDLHLIRLEDTVGELPAPLDALVGLNDRTFRDEAPLCLFGHSHRATLGTISRDDASIGCLAPVIDGSAPLEGSESHAYGNADVFATFELAGLTTYVETSRSELASLQVKLDTLEDAEATEKVLTALEEGERTFQEGVAEAMKAIHPTVQSRASVLVEQKLGRTLAALDAHKTALRQRLTDFEIERRVDAFSDAHIKPILEELARATGVQAVPIQLDAANAEHAKLVELAAHRRALVKLVEEKLPVAARQAGQERVHAMIGGYDKALNGRLSIVSTAVTKLGSRLRINQVAEDATVAMANVTAEQKSPKKALALYQGLQGHYDAVRQALDTKESDPAIAKYAADKLPLVLSRLSATMGKLEPALPSKIRLVSYARWSKEVLEEAKGKDEAWDTISLVSAGLTEFRRLFRSEDPVQVQIDGLLLWTGLRNDVLEQIRSHMNLERDAEKGEVVSDAFQKGLRTLPARNRRAANPEAARMAKLLKTNGFAWAYWQDDRDAKGDNRWDGPDLYVVEWWRAAKIKPYVEPSVTAWLHCTDAIAADWRRNHSYLKTCDKAFALHAKQEHIREMAAEIHAGLETVHKELDHKRCLTMRWKHPRAFFVDTLKEQCRIIGDREKKQRAIARAQKEIRKYIAKKNFRYARMLLPKLEKAGAEPWEIENAAGSIDTAERFEKDRKAKQEAEQRGNRLMNLVPNFERTCLRELQTWTFAHNQLHRSAKHGQLSLAEYWEQAKARSGARGCDARRQATEAYTIHEGQGHLMAANAVLEGAGTCFRSWSCEE